MVFLKEKLEEHKIWKENFQTDFETLPENIRDICEYGFTEMLNNAIDHSEGTRAIIRTEWEPGSITITIDDDGIGIFRKIKNALNLEDERESVLHLSKGKFTTDPENHTGEGIFFTSRVFDEFLIFSYKVYYQRENRDEDWFIETFKNSKLLGTGLRFKINLSSKIQMREVFAEFTSEDTDGRTKFDKTHIIVQLSKLGDERYVSRSQARRICLGLENFKQVVLDFKDVSRVGQGFVDEVFRVFQSKHPKIKIEYTNTGEDVRFMIERSLPFVTAGEES